ncbi:HD domain-containing protein [Streptomyces asoensis]
MEDSAAVAGLVWDMWLPIGVRRLIADALPGGEADGRRLVVWIAGVHDVGKATPAFACQVDQLADVMRDKGLEMRSARRWGRIDGGAARAGWPSAAGGVAAGAVWVGGQADGPVHRGGGRTSRGAPGQRSDQSPVRA